MIRNHQPRPLPASRQRPSRARAAIASRQGREAVLARAAALGATLLLGAAVITAGQADAQERGAPALDYNPRAETPSRVVPGGQALLGDRPVHGGSGAEADTQGWALEPAPAVAPSRTVGTGPGRPATDETEPQGEPTAYRGAYRLVSVNGQDLPVQIDRFRRQDGTVCSEHVLSGAIQLMRGNRYVVRNLSRVDCPEGSSEQQQEVERGTWKLTGNAVYLNEDRIRGEEPAHGQYMADVPIDNLGGTGELEGRRLIIGLEDGRSVAVFEATRGERVDVGRPAGTGKAWDT